MVIHAKLTSVTLKTWSLTAQEHSLCFGSSGDYSCHCCEYFGSSKTCVELTIRGQTWLGGSALADIVIAVTMTILVSLR